jgi:predicted dehydrogenase
MKIGLVGCGVIGERRIQNLPKDCEFVGAFDVNNERANKLTKQYGGKTYASLDELITGSGCQALIVAAINSALVEIAKTAAQKNIPVLIEKPAARSYTELKTLLDYPNKIVKIGFNHRFHPAFLDIVTELTKHTDDPVMYINASYGNGARVGFDREWRANVELSGGGELLDQGVHLLDLATVILPDLAVKTSWVRTQYWDMPVDDNAWATLSTPKGQTFSMHVSSSEWKNDFRFEVYTRKRKYQWLGLGRSYGPEKLTIYTMKPEMGPPEINEKSYPPEDHSWLNENKNFIEAIKGKAKLYGGLEDALKVLKDVEKIYEKSFDVFKGSEEEKNIKHPKWWV